MIASGILKEALFLVPKKICWLALSSSISENARHDLIACSQTTFRPLS
ncbi:hypothetical protein SAMN03159288_04645 [Rhizobium sp. NFACC06-2]|nr:hypothetical protein SAMN03159288_04645 [Rhizobium sp. NFACC06-2]